MSKFRVPESDLTISYAEPVTEITFFDNDDDTICVDMIKPSAISNPSEITCSFSILSSILFLLLHITSRAVSIVF